VPAPFLQAAARAARGRTLLRLNVSLIALWPPLFACQSFFVVPPWPRVWHLLVRAEAAAARRANAAGATEP
jgi:hypothetical protein